MTHDWGSARPWLSGDEPRRDRAALCGGGSAEAARAPVEPGSYDLVPRSAHGALSVAAWDDEGVVPRDYRIVRDGVLWDLQSTRELVRFMESWFRQSNQSLTSHGQTHAQSWADVQFHCMPNINLLPHPDRHVTLEELIGGVRRGILIDGERSFSIDQQQLQRAVRRPGLSRDP